MNDGMERMWKEAVITCLKVKGFLSGGTEKSSVKTATSRDSKTYI
jgi:hypothetical protein